MNIEKKLKLSLNEIVLYGAFVVIVLIGTFSNSNFLSFRNFLSVFQQMSEMGIMALGLTVVILTGGIDLSCGTTMGLCAVITGLCLTSGLPIFITMIISLITAVLCGALNAALVAIIKIPPMIATLGSQMLFYGIALVLSKGTSISSIPDSFYFLGQSKIYGIPLQALILFVFLILTLMILRKRKFGKYIYAIGNNIKASHYSGVPTTKVLFGVYILSAVLSSVSGSIQVSRVATARADMGSVFVMQCISAIVLGGTSMDGGVGGVSGTVIGILIFSMIGNILNLVGISSFWQNLATGGILVIVVVFNRILEKQRKNSV